jgi:sigma-B regulation protein RsbU (phosphoserine phosphatase)
LIVVVSWKLTAPIKRLAVFARKLAAGDLDAHVGDVRLAEEIDQLAHTFDKMVVDLKSNIEHRIHEEAARRAVEHDLQAAKRIQESLLPRLFPPFPNRREFDLHATCNPATLVGGDFFDFFFLDPHTLAFLIADVSGHGIAAAFFMAVSRTAIRNSAIPERVPHEIIGHINQTLDEGNDDKMFVTLFYGHYNTVTGELTYVNAGHDPPFLVRKDGTLETLPATGPLVAVFGDASYYSRTIRLEVGDVLVTFTDGVTEAHSVQDNILYSVKRLESLLPKIHHEHAAEICNRIYRDVDQFAKHERHDDITLLVLKRNE